MRVTIKREEFLAAFRIAASAAARRTPKEILKHVLFSAENTLVTLSATNIDTSCITELVGSVGVSQPGKAVLPVERVTAILTESRDTKLELTIEGNHLRIAGNSCEFRLQAIPCDDFPVIEKSEPTQYHCLSPAALRFLIRSTIYVTDEGSARYALGGVSIEFSSSELRGVATDGRRLAVVSVPARDVGEQSAKLSTSQVILPASAAKVVDRIAAGLDADAEVHLSVTGNAITIAFEHVTLRCLMLEGRFPKWENIIPKTKSEMPLSVPAMLLAVRQAAIVASDDSKGLQLSMREKRMHLAGNTAGVGESLVEFPVASEDEYEVCLDGEFLKEFLSTVEESECTMHYSTSESAVMFATDSGYRYVVMPMTRN